MNSSFYSMKNKLFLIVIALIYLYFMSYPMMESMLKMLSDHKGDTGISDVAKYFVIAQYIWMAFFPPFLLLVTSIFNGVKSNEGSLSTNPTGRERFEGENPYKTPESDS